VAESMPEVVLKKFYRREDRRVCPSALTMFLFIALLNGSSGQTLQSRMSFDALA